MHGGNLCGAAALLYDSRSGVVGNVVEIEMRAAPGAFDDAVGVGLDILNDASVQATGGQAASEAAQYSFHHSRGFPLGPSLGPLFGQQSIKAFLYRFHFPFGLSVRIVAVCVSAVEKLHLFHDALIPSKWVVVVHSDGEDGPKVAPQGGWIWFPNPWKEKPRYQVNRGMCLECRLFG